MLITQHPRLAWHHDIPAGEAAVQTQQLAFAALLQHAPQPTEREPSQRQPRPFTPYQGRLGMPPGTRPLPDSAHVTLRLLNGPMAGMRVHATLQDGTLRLRVYLSRGQRNECGPAWWAALEHELATQYHRPFELEFMDADVPAP